MSLIHIGALAHKDEIQVFSMKLEVLGTAVARIGDRPLWRGAHALSELVKRGTIEGFIIGFANEVLSRDHKTLAVERKLKHGAKFRFGMPFAFLDGSGIEIVERDQAMGKLMSEG